MNAEIRLRVGNGLHDRGVQLFARPAACILHLAPRGFLGLPAQFPLFHRFDHTRDVFLEALLHLGELRFQFLDSLLLPFDPLRAQFPALFFQFMPLSGHLLPHPIEFVAAAMQISD